MRLKTTALAAATAALALAVMPGTAASAAVGDRWEDGTEFHKVVHDGGVPFQLFGAPYLIEATCPPSHPWLHKPTGTDGRSVGHGYIVGEEAFGVIVTWTGSMVRVWDDEGRGGVAQATLRAENIIPFTTQGLYVEMVCTSDHNQAWQL
ncbi:hypothetical protein [Agromyces silvae]|uniref:hypothetical protein n=1 Tax=Agromyces silvae TaxID=3388266 RepID=UPI00280A8660|nr:hypothetical protein [Agromyces protaetiae]